MFVFVCKLCDMFSFICNEDNYNDLDLVRCNNNEFLAEKWLNSSIKKMN